MLRTPFAQRRYERQHTHRFPGTPALPGNFLDVWEMNVGKNKTESGAVRAGQD
jgi:hypothetical protein